MDVAPHTQLLVGVRFLDATSNLAKTINGTRVDLRGDAARSVTGEIGIRFSL